MALNLPNWGGYTECANPQVSGNPTKKDVKTHLNLLITLLLATACNERHNIVDTKEIVKPKTFNRDSLVNALYQYAHPYFKMNSLDSIVALKGRPKYITNIPLGDENEIADSMLTVGYNYSEFLFWKNGNSKPRLGGVYLFDKNVLLPGNLSIGKTTRQDILQSLGLPDGDHNDPGRSMTKSGDTTVYGIQSGAGDTVTFTYDINIDEYSIGLAITKDTLRKVSWTKNPY